MITPSVELLSLRDAARLIGVSPSAMYRLTGRGVIPRRVEGRVFFARVDLDRYRAERSAQSGDRVAVKKYRVHVLRRRPRGNR